MFKKLLTSALVLGVLAATVGGATYAVFTDSGTATGTVSAATVDLLLDGNDTATVTFAPQDLLPGETSYATVLLANNSSGNTNISTVASVAIAETIDVFGNGDCWAGYFTVAPISVPNLGPSGSTSVTIAASLDINAGNECQGNAWSVAVTFTSTGY